MNAASCAAPLLIRADSSTRIGVGHVMRCLALAQAWQDAGGEVTFACAELPDGLHKRLSVEQCHVVRFDAVSGSLGDAKRTRSLARDVDACAIVVDGYDFGPDFQLAVHRAGRLVMIIDDDGRHGSYHADVILNQNLHADESIYPRHQISAQLLLGPKYVLLRREFREYEPRPRQFPQEARRILVTLGGADGANMTGRVLENIASLDRADLEVLVILGPANSNVELLRELASRTPFHTDIELDPPDLPKKMEWADLAITAAGSTVWELSSLGVPMLAIPIADNQRRIADSLQERGLALTASPDGRLVFNSALARLIADPELRRSFSRRSRSCIRDGAASAVTELLSGLRRRGVLTGAGSFKEEYRG